jgi:hypothetical protein
MFAFGFWFYFKLFVNLIFVAVESIFYSFLHLYKPCSIGATPIVPGKILTGSGEYSYRIWGDSYRIWGYSYRIWGIFLQDLGEITTGYGRDSYRIWGDSYRILGKFLQGFGANPIDEWKSIMIFFCKCSEQYS